MTLIKAPAESFHLMFVSARKHRILYKFSSTTLPKTYDGRELIVDYDSQGRILSIEVLE